MIDEALAAFGASRTRVEILHVCVRQGTVSTRDLVVALDISVSGARKHLAALVRAGVLTTAERRLPGARWDRIWQIDVDALRAAIDDLDTFFWPT